MIILKRIVVLIASIVFLSAQDDKAEKFHFQFEIDSLELHVGEAKEITKILIHFTLLEQL